MTDRKKHNWPVLIKEQELSGKTVNAFCKAKKIHYTSFYKNRKRLQSGSLVEIKIDRIERESEQPITLKYGKYSLDLSPGFCKQTLQDVLYILDTAQC